MGDWADDRTLVSDQATANLNRFNHWASLLGVPQAMLLSAGAFTDKSNPTEAMLVQLLMQVGSLLVFCLNPETWLTVRWPGGATSGDLSAAPISGRWRAIG